MCDNSSVKVAVRIRPLVQSEIEKGSREILDVVEENNQVVVLNSDKAFTYNYVLSSQSQQDDLYDRCVQNMISNLFNGYNVTILAYGQTGSGKTHSMGTAYKGDGDMGVIPRAVNDIFSFIRDNFSLDFTITVSFMELYQEVLYDLLSDKPRDQRTLEIREDVTKGIYTPGLTEIPVNSVFDVLEALARGSLSRATGSTNMNSQSSRSHAIFTLNICMQNKENCRDNKMAKLHLVDLAGSERPKKTGAVGNTFKEGVNINKGLFVLGNVISSLGDESKQNGYIPYRDSNLTRLLKDSLGGNSITLMIACISPADYNLEETLSTLRYADRARKIKNKPVVNQDAKSAEINELKKTIQQLKLQIVGQGGPVICPAEIELLKKEINDLRLKIRDLTLKLSATLRDNTEYMEKLLILQHANEESNKKISELKDQYDITFHNISLGVENNDPQLIKEHIIKLQDIQNQFVIITNNQKQAETEIRKHEETFTKAFTSASANSAEIEPEIQEKHESHTTKQMAMTTELKEISHQLTIKEHLAQQLANNVQYMVDYSAMAENEAKMLALEKEKNELLQQVKTIQGAQGSQGKVAEQRRKRVHELESQIHDLMKKVQEQARLIKMKEKDENRIKQLNQEILQMKQVRVKLVRSMREESDKFRQWKLQRERELARLKHEDRKKQNKIVQMEAMQTKQQNVFKRKVEEAAALNKRLREVLAVRKQAQDTKHSGKVQKIGCWLKQEFDVYISVVEAETTLRELLEDRATLQQQLDKIKDDPEMASAPECKALHEDIELRSIQIQDLQQKILDSDEETKSKTRFDNIQTMGEAKFALKTIFEYTADIKKKEVLTQAKLNEQCDAQSELNDKIQEYEQNIKSIKEASDNEKAELQKSYEEKVAVLLRQLRGVKTEDVGLDEELRQRCEIQLENIFEQNKIIEELKKQNSELLDKVRVINDVAQGNKTPENVRHTLKVEPETKVAKSPKKLAENLLNGTYVLDQKENIVESDLSFDDDDKINDPDWRKTPLGKRIIEAKRASQFKSNNGSFGDKMPVKRSSDGGCTCKTKCSNRCGCWKVNKACTSNCRCKLDSCNNRSERQSSLDGDSGEGSSSVKTDEEDSFKKPRLFDDGMNRKQLSKSRNKTRLLFDLN